jgi:hypothetical protein
MYCCITPTFHPMYYYLSFASSFVTRSSRIVFHTSQSHVLLQTSCRILALLIAASAHALPRTSKSWPDTIQPLRYNPHAETIHMPRARTELDLLQHAFRHHDDA